MKLSYAFLMTLFSLLSVTIIVAEDVSNGKEQGAEAKWFRPYGLGYGTYNNFGYNSLFSFSNTWAYSNAFNFGNLNTFNVFPSLNPFAPQIFAGAFCNSAANNLWFKSVDGHQARRSIAPSLPSTLVARDGETRSIECQNHKGERHTFDVKSCTEAAAQMASQKSSTATVKGCQVKLVGQSGELAANQISAKDLQQATANALKSCKVTSKNLLSNKDLTRRSPAEVAQQSNSNAQDHKNLVALVIMNPSS